MKTHQKQEIEQTSTKNNLDLKFQRREKNKTSNKLEIPKNLTKKNKANDRKETIELEKLKRREKKKQMCFKKSTRTSPKRNIR